MSARTLAETGLLTGAAAVIGSIGTDVTSRWYRDADKPSFQPPPIVFPLVWTPLYADIAVSSAAVIGSDPGFRGPLYANLGLNTAWTWLFFRAKRPALATAESVVLAASSVDLVRRAAKVDRRAALALAPYAAWTVFATVLSGTFAGKNRRRRRPR